MSDKEKPSESSPAPEKEAPAFTNQHLKALVNTPDFKIDNPDPAVAAAQEKHLKGLATIAGPETIAHFDRMCQYLFEQEQVAKKDGKGVSDAV